MAFAMLRSALAITRDFEEAEVAPPALAAKSFHY
jgi:hypothetical protein